MAILDALGAKLQADGVGTLGTDIFLSRMMDDPDACVALYETQGLGPQHNYGAGVQALSRPRIRMLARGAKSDYPSARTLCASAQAVLGAIRNETLSGIDVLCVLDTTGIYPVRFDTDERPTLACDFIVWIG